MLENEWLPMAEYCRITGDTQKAVISRLNAGHWKRGEHVSTPDGGKMFVSIIAVLIWVHPRNAELFH